MTRRAGLAAALVMVAALAGCATPVESVGGPGTADLSLAGGPYGESCDSAVQASLPPEETLTDGAHLTLATRCIYTSQTVPGDGEWSVRLDQRATDGLDALAAALRLPSTEDRGLPCPAIAYLPVVITVTEDTGRSFRPAIPTEACGAPLAAVTDAITTMLWTTTASTRLQQVRTELEVSSGCVGAYKPMIAIVALDQPGGTERSTVDTTPRELLVCKYDVGTEEMGLVGDVMLHSGVLVGASTLQPDATHELLAAIDEAPTAEACPTPESPFAVIGSTNNPSAWVELGGCHRAWFGTDSALRQLDAALVTRLLG